MDTKLLTSEQVADILGVTGHTLAVWRCTGRYDLPYVKSGRLVRYREADVTGFIERRIMAPFSVGSNGTRTRP
ncbi:MAG: helix-turn-helix domain-containing protein [Pseudomonadota bacterium]